LRAGQFTPIKVELGIGSPKPSQQPVGTFRRVGILDVKRGYNSFVVPYPNRESKSFELGEAERRQPLAKGRDTRACLSRGELCCYNR
jgi:hypothetical protein